MFSLQFNDAVRASFVGSGDPNTLSPMPDPTAVGTCTEGVYFNTLPDTRNPAAVTTWVWDGVSAWFARP